MQSPHIRTLRFPDDMEVPIISIGGFQLEGNENGEVQIPVEHLEQALAHGLIDVDAEKATLAAEAVQAEVAAKVAARKSGKPIPRSRPKVNR